MKRGTFKIRTNLFRFRDNTIIAKVYVRNNNKAILTKTFTIQQPITPEAEVKKSVVYNDPEAETINHYFNLFKQEVKQLAETSTPETIADDIERLVEAPVFSKFFCNGKRHEKETGNMKYGTFKVNATLFTSRVKNLHIVVVGRNKGEVIYKKNFSINKTISPEAEIKKGFVYNDPEAETINYYFNLNKQEVKQLAETSTPETIADDIQKLAEAPVFSSFIYKKSNTTAKERVISSVQWNSKKVGRERDIDRDVRIIRDFDPYAFNDDFENKAHVLHTMYRNKFGEPLCLKENYKRAVKNGSYSGTQEGYYSKIKPYLDDIESWQQIQDDEELKQRMEIYNNDRLIDFALDDEPTEEKEYAPYISRDQWEVMMDDYIKKLKIKWQQEKQQTAEK